MNKSISKQMTLFISFMAFIFVLVFFTIFIIIERDNIYAERSHLVNAFGEMIVSISRRPLSQGNYIEVESNIRLEDAPDFINKVKVFANDEEIASYSSDDKCNDVLNYKFDVRDYAINESLGTVIVQSSECKLKNQVWRVFFLSLVTFVMILIIAYFFLRRLIQKIFYPLVKVVNQAANYNDIEGDLNLNAPDEIKPLINKMIELAKEEKDALLTKQKYEINRQVAHDIKSPLSALEIVMDDIEGLPQDSKELTLNAISRIQQIANGLSVQYESEVTGKNLISLSTEQILKEKIVELKEYNLIINFEDMTNKSLFVNLSQVEWGRILSNLLNNAAEALSYSGKINIYLEAIEQKIIVTICDNGKGFPKEILNSQIQKGNSFNKESGQGLGLFHAKTTIEKVSGHIELYNDNGAVIKMYLPVIEPPKWFSEVINLEKYNDVMIIDDDITIHSLWKKIFKTKGINIDTKYLFREKDILPALASVNFNTFVFMDYDLGKIRNGLSLIKDFNLHHSVLVTNEYYRTDLQNLCEQNDVKIIPKRLISNLIKGKL